MSPLARRLAVFTALFTVLAASTPLSLAYCFLVLVVAAFEPPTDARPGPRASALLRVLLLGCFAGAAAAVLVARAQAIWCLVPILALAFAPRPFLRWPRALRLLLIVPVWIGVAAFAESREASEPRNHAMIRGSQVLGANPGQSFSLAYAPGRTLDFVLDDRVEPRPEEVPDEVREAWGGAEAPAMGYEVEALAARIEGSLRAAAHRLEPLDDPGIPLSETAARIRAHRALAQATVRAHSATQLAAGAQPGEGAKLSSGLGLVIVSGDYGRRAILYSVCPGRLIGEAPRSTAAGNCPRKHASQAGVGLGLSAAWPGYTELPGSEGVGLEAFAARWVEPQADSEGVWGLLWPLLWMVACLTAFALIFAAAPRDERPSPLVDGAALAGTVFALIAIVGGLALAPTTELDAWRLEPGQWPELASAIAHRLGLVSATHFEFLVTLSAMLALLLFFGAARATVSDPASQEPRGAWQWIASALVAWLALRKPVWAVALVAGAWGIYSLWAWRERTRASQGRAATPRAEKAAGDRPGTGES